MSVKRLGDQKYRIRITYTHDGQRKDFRRQFFGSLKEARRVEREMKNEAKLGSLTTTADEPEQRVLFEDFAWEWHETYVKANNRVVEQRTKQTYLRIHLVPFFKDMCLDSISRRDIEEFKALKLSQGAAPQSVNLYRSCLRKLFQCAVDWDLLKKNPVHGVAKVRDRDEKWEFLDFSEADKFMQAVPPNWQPLFLCALRTGMRQGEIVALRWRDLDWNRKAIRVRNSASDGKLCPTKSYRAREVPIPKDLLEALISIRNNNSEFVFAAQNGSMLHPKTLLRPLRTANKNSGVKRIRFHDMRHSYASHLVMTGAPIKAVQELLGHRDLTTTQKYAHLTPDCRKAVVDQLEHALARTKCGENVALRSQG